jgi:hypothetical protein
MTIFNEAVLLIVAINNNQQMQIGDYGSAEAAKPLGDVGKLVSRPPLKPSQGRTPCIFLPLSDTAMNVPLSCFSKIPILVGPKRTLFALCLSPPSSTRRLMWLNTLLMSHITTPGC